MRPIDRRFAKLEKIFAPVVESEDRLGRVAEFRHELLAQAEQQGATSVADLRAELERIGPSGRWIAAARGYLSDHGFVRSESESFAQTMARALGINTDELRV
jgi:hypothetical protein